MAIVNGESGFTQFRKVNVLETLLERGRPILSGDISLLADGVIPVVQSGEFTASTTTQRPDGSWLFGKDIEVPGGSVSIGEVITISEGASDLIVNDKVNNTSGFSINSLFTAAGAQPPSYIAFGATFTNPLQPIDTTNITANPLIFNVTAVVPTSARLVNSVKIRAFAGMTNFRAKITDNATGVALRYIPDKLSFDSGTGLTILAGDTIFDFISTSPSTPTQFNLGVNPFEVVNGQVVTFDVRADSISVQGNASGIPFLETVVQDGNSTVVGGAPAGTLAGHITSFDGAGGFQQVSDVFLRATSATDDPAIQVQDHLGTNVFVITSDINTTENGILSAYPFLIQAAGGNNLTLQALSTGQIVFDSTNLTLSGSIMALDNVTSGVAKYQFRDATNERGFIGYDTTQNAIVVDSKQPGNTETLIRSDNAVVIEYGSGSGFIDLTNSSGTGSDLENIAVVQNKGTNAGAYEIHVGGRNPEGNVLAPEGAHYYRSGASPAEYIKTTGIGSATGWGEVRHTLNSNNGDVFGPASSVNQSMAIFDNTTGKLLDDAPQAIWFESGDQRAMTFYSPVASTGVIGVQLHRSTLEIRSAWEFRESSQGTDFVAAGSGDFRIAQDNTSSSGNLLIQNNGTTGGNISLTTTAPNSTISLACGSTGTIDIDAGLGSWRFDDNTFETTASGASVTSQIDFKNSGGTTTGSLQNQNSGSVFTLNSTYEILLQTSSANGIHLQNDNAVGSIRNANTASPDTIANTIFSNGGTNPGSSALHVGNRNPEGNVTANGGALYVRDDPTNPDLYVKVGDATNTGWESLRNSVLTDPIATMYRPLTGSSAGQSITTGPQPILAFNTDGINTNTALLESDATTERIDVKQITDTTNGDIYRVNFNAIWRGTTGVRMTFDFVTLSAGSATTTNLEAEVVNNNVSDENSVSISGVVRGPSTLSGVTGFRVQFAGNTTGSVAWDHVHMSVERIG